MKNARLLSIKSSYLTAAFLLAGLAIALQLSARASFGIASRPNRVDLIVPVESGAELGQLDDLYPGLQLLELNGQMVLLLGRYSDARLAYEDGRAMQAKLKLQFEIVYPPSHPQADGRWLAALNRGTPQAKRSRPAPYQRASAGQLGGMISLADLDLKPVPLAASRPAPPASDLLPEPQPVVVEPDKSKPMARRLLVANTSLHYLVAQVDSPEQARRLSELVGSFSLAPAEADEQDSPTMFAQVGVFSPTKTGKRLLLERKEQLAYSGIRGEVKGAPL